MGGLGLGEAVRVKSSAKSFRDLEFRDPTPGFFAWLAAMWARLTIPKGFSP